MLVVAQNLAGLVRTAAICPESLTEEFSLRLRIDSRIRRMRESPKVPGAITYGTRYDARDYFHDEEIVDRDVLLAPGSRLLACTADRYRMPSGYFGLVQTKGSLARLFVAATCNDGQIEPGYDGKITLEMSNDSRYPVILPVGANVAQMFVFRCTTVAERPYDGRYQHATGPTVADFATSD